MYNKICNNLILKSLYKILSSEFKWYNVMLELVKSERDVVVNDKVEELVEITKKKEEIISAIESLEQERKNLIDRIASEFNLSHEQLSLDKIAELADEDYSSRFIKLRRRMKELLNEIIKINERNLQIVEKSMNTFNTTIEILLSESNPTLTYSRSGKLEKLDSINGSLLRRIGHSNNYEA